MKKKIISIIMLVILCTTIMGCSAVEDNLPKIGVAIYKYDDTYISTVKNSLIKEAQSTAQLLLNDGKGDQGTQNDQIDLLIEKGVDVLLVNVVDVGAAQTIVNKAKNADIPIVFFNREPSLEVLKSYDKARFIGTNAKDAGVIQGEIIAQIWKDDTFDKNKDGVMQYVMFKGEPDNPEAVARTEWSIKRAQELGVKTEELGLQVANWDTELANRAMEAWISKFGDQIEFVVANNDGMAQGAISALQAANYNKGDKQKFIPVVGVDATDAAKELISKEYMSGTVVQDGEEMGRILFKASMNLYEGKDVIEGTEYQYDETGISIRIPYKSYIGENLKT